MDTKRCKLCNVPKIVSKVYFWNPNGILEAFKGEIKKVGTFLELSMFNHIFSGIESRMGLSLGMMLEAVMYDTAKVYVDAALSGLKGRIARSRFFCERVLKVDMDVHSCVVGVSRTELIEYKHKKKVIWRIEKPPPFPISFQKGLQTGSMSSLWRVPTKVNWQEKEDHFIVTIEPVRHEPEVRKYLIAPKRPKPLPGNIKYHPCPSCGVPKEVSEVFEWNWDRGAIVEKKTEIRWALQSTDDLTTIFLALEKELGEEIPKLILEVEKENIRKDFTRTDLKGTEEDYKNLFNPIYFGVRGWGNPVEVSKRDKELGVRIDNPFNEVLLAGIIGGSYEAIEKAEAEVQWTTNTEGYTIITVAPE